MKIDNTNLSMVRGDTETINVTCIGYTLADGDKVELTVRKNVKSDAVIHKTVTEFDDGKATFIIEPSDTSSLNFGIYKYDIQLTTSIGQIYTLVSYSNFVIEKEVTYE